jgi:hypothetical protein
VSDIGIRIHGTESAYRVGQHLPMDGRPYVVVSAVFLPEPVNDIHGNRWPGQWDLLLRPREAPRDTPDA